MFFDGYSGPTPNDITDVGVLSPYDTAGQGGNIAEWEETTFDLLNNSAFASRGARGGDWQFDSFSLSVSNRAGYGPHTDGFNGFRVASIPEPTSLLMAAMAALGLLLRRKSKYH